MKRFVCIGLTLLIMITGMTLEVYAFPGNYFWFPNNMHVRIYHPSSGMYLGIDRNGNEVDGARIQLQNYEEGNQNQIFYIKAVSRDTNGRIQYQIRVHGESEMVVEIRNSSHDDWAEAAQWTTHYGNCAKWYFFTETNRNGYDRAICCITNVESGKMLNVAGNEHYDGNNLIQYHEDDTEAEVFEIISVEEEITGAMWTRDWSQINNGMYWSYAKDTAKNREKYFTPINYYSNGYIVYPRARENTSYLATVLWLDGNLQKKILQLHYPPTSALTQLKQALGEAGREQIIDIISSKLGIGAIPVGDIEAIISVLLTGQSEQQWYRIEEAFKNHSKVRIEIYYKFKNGRWGVNCYPIVNDTIDTYWSGDKSNIGNWVDMGYSNTWIYGGIEYFYK